MTTETALAREATTEVAGRRGYFNWWRILLYAIAIIFTAYYLLPIFLMVLTGLKSYNEINLYEMWSLPRQLSFQSFIDAWVGSPSVAGLGRNFVNSLRVAIPATLISAILGAMNGYVLSKWKFRSADIIFPLLLFGMFIPYQSILIPLVTTLNALRIGGSLEGLTFVHIVYGIPVCALIFRNYYATIPNEMIEAARIDGANFFSIFTRIMLPLSAPGFVVVAIWQFTNIWNDFLFAITVTNNPANQPITVALNNLAGSFTVEWNVQFAAALIAAAPTILLYILLGPFFVRGLMAGSLKG
ncbi:MAG: carbohydrate ABC transporter permease [Chloroflexi bacterium]|nr:carbohydrate ABC transporter permease [Chloroflexota bacterium]